MTHPISLDEPGRKMLLLGNEAIARGAIEAGIGLASSYPGTPSTEVLETLSVAAKDLGFYVEWSVNEKVALEVAFGASITGVRSLVAMKHVGVNVALDSLISLGYTGVIGGLVVVSAEDPSMHSSQNEQDNRWIGLMGYIPVFEAYNPNEAKELARYLFDFSEENSTPVILRTTTRLSHTRGIVEYGEIRDRTLRGKFRRDLGRWVLIPRHARKRREAQLERWKMIERDVNNIPFNWIEKDGSEYGVIGVGMAYGYVKEVKERLGLKVDLLKISSSIPPPYELIREFMENHEGVLVVEELEPIVESLIKSQFYNRMDTRIFGKDLVGYVGELTFDRVYRAIASFLGLEYVEAKDYTLSIDIPARPPVLCPGCPHRPTFFVIRKAVNMSRVKAIYPGDIGCYTLGVLPPYRGVDTTISMGSGIGIGNGLAQIQDQMVIVTIGDSTFYHAGIPGLINAVFNKSPLLLIVMDNEVTAMTGDQPNPGTGYNALGAETNRIPIENIARGVGVEKVEVVDPYDIKEMLEAMKTFIRYVKEEGKPAVLVARRECSLVFARRARERGDAIPTYYVNDEKCTGCRICVDQFACPAIFMIEDKAWVDGSMCTGCSVCRQLCPFDAFEVRER